MLFFSPIAISIVGTFFFFLFISLICTSVCPIRIGNITDPLSDTDKKTIRFSSTMDYDYSHNNTYLYFSRLFVLCHRTSLHHVWSHHLTRQARSRFVYELLYAIVNLSNGIFLCIWIICIYYVGIQVWDKAFGGRIYNRYNCGICRGRSWEIIIPKIFLTVIR